MYVMFEGKRQGVNGSRRRRSRQATQTGLLPFAVRDVGFAVDAEHSAPEKTKSGRLFADLRRASGPAGFSSVASIPLDVPGYFGKIVNVGRVRRLVLPVAGVAPFLF